jgi:hypothetical protein
MNLCGNVNAMDVLEAKLRELPTTFQRLRPTGFSEASKMLNYRKILEPRVGVEPTTCRLRIGCSTTELPRP